MAVDLLLLSAPLNCAGRSVRIESRRQRTSPSSSLPRLSLIRALCFSLSSVSALQQHLPIPVSLAMASEKLVARKGRLRQRYEDEHRLVAGCVPYRVGKDGQLQVLMVSTTNRDGLVFPKGGWEDDEDVHEAACREALEEAGVRGNINRNSLGLWVFRSKSSQSESGDSPRGACKGHVFALEVTEELEQWPEQDMHGRRWVSPADAYGLCRYDWMREALTALLDRCSMASASAIPAPATELNEHAGMCMNMTLMKPAAVADRAVALC